MKRANVRLLSHLRNTDIGLSLFLIMTVFFVFILPPLGLVGMRGRLLVDIFFSLFIVSGIASTSGRKVVFVLVAVISTIALILRWAGFIIAAPSLEILNYVATICSAILFFAVILARVLKEGPITFRRIEGAIAAYLLLGFSWASGYELIAYFDPDSFSGAITVSGYFSSWIYFSFVTLATLGYGDIAPIHPLARSLATSEAILGQLYLAILIARLVSQELFYRQLKSEDCDKCGMQNTDASDTMKEKRG